jgi:hypothetical protein
MTTQSAGELPAPPPRQTRWVRFQVTVAGTWRCFRQSVLLLHVRGKLRRQWLVNFRPDYVRRQLARRQGECRQCGVCCALGNTCPMLHSQRHCLIYHGYRPKSCCVFPVDERDLLDVKAAGGTCGYVFPAGAAR